MVEHGIADRAPDNTGDSDISDQNPVTSPVNWQEISDEQAADLAAERYEAALEAIKAIRSGKTANRFNKTPLTNDRSKSRTPRESLPKSPSVKYVGDLEETINVDQLKDNEILIHISRNADKPTNYVALELDLFDRRASTEQYQQLQNRLGRFASQGLVARDLNGLSRPDKCL